MGIKVLVAYASTHGSTQEVAEVVTTTLRDHGLAVDLKRARDVRALDGYRAVVLGAPLYMFRLHGDALRFLSRHQQALKGDLPIAIFAGGPFGEGAGEAWQEVRQHLDRELAKFPWLRPVSVEVIGGRFDPARLRLPWSLIPGLRRMPPSDLRDWEAIRGWARSLAASMQATSTLAGLYQPAIAC